MTRFRPTAAPGFAMFSLLMLAPFVHAQTTPAAPKAPFKSTKTTKSSAKSPNVKSGILVAIDTKEETITIKDRLGKTSAYTLTDKTRFLKAKREAEVTAFKPGDAIVVHTRKARDSDEPLASEVADKESWTWIDGIRHNLTEAVITAMDEDGLTVAIGTAKIPLTFATSDKTMWAKNGKEATSTDFKVGEKVCILPRALPSGTIMARAITDTPAAAEQMKERQATSVHGVVKSIEASTFKLTLTTTAGDTRLLQGNIETQVMQKSHTVTWATLKTGQSVAARLRRNYAGESICWKLTIDAGKTVKADTTKMGAKSAPKP